MSKYRRLLFVAALLSFTLDCKVYAQIETTPPQKNTIICAAVIHDGDTIAYMSLPQVDIIAERTFANAAERNKYLRLRRDVKKAYPYAILASLKLKEINAALENISGKGDQRRFIKNKERELKEQFEEDLKNLTINQGKILIRLIDRETGNTSYELVKEMRGTLSAFMWQSLASFFGSSLKTKYDPTQGEDKLIEGIIHQIENGDL